MGELMAVLDLFKSTAHVAHEPLHILCDSQYVINSVTKWMPGWKRKGWRKSDGKPVLNVELLKEIDAAITGRKYTFEWVKGHAGHDLNEAADDRARDAATAYQAKREPNAGPGFPGSTATVSEPASSVHTETVDAGPSGSFAPTAGASLASNSTAQLLAEPDQLDLFSILDDEPDPSFETDRDTTVEAVVGLERELLDPAVRADPLRLAELLHPDFREIGSSGRLLSRQDILDLLADEQASQKQLEVLSLERLDTATALLTYRSISGESSALRSSLWQHENGHWRLRFHQGTREA